MSQSKFKKLRQVLRNTGVAISEANYRSTDKNAVIIKKISVAQPEPNKDGTTRFKTQVTPVPVSIKQDVTLAPNCGRAIYQKSKKMMKANSNWLKNFMARQTAAAQ